MRIIAMPAKAATTQNSQVNPGRRRFLNLDLLVKITVPLLLIFLLLIALEMESFGWYARLFRRNTYTTFWVLWEHFIPWLS